MAVYTINVTQQLDDEFRGMASSLEETMAFVILSDQFSQLSDEISLPPPRFLFRYGAGEETSARQKSNFAQLAAGFSIIGMVSAFEDYLNRLLFIRRVAEKMGDTKSLSGDNVNRIRERVQKEGKSNSPAKLVRLLLTGPSDDIKVGAEWLEGIYKVRNSLAHRMGYVDERDADENGLLEVKWRRVTLLANGDPIESVGHFVNAGDKVSIQISDEQRTWGIGDKINVDPADCQQMALSLSLLGASLKNELHSEIARILIPDEVVV